MSKLRGILAIAFSLICCLAASGQSRAPWTTSKIHGAPTPPPPFQVEVAFPNLRFQNPTVLTNAPGVNRLFVCELRGKIYSFPNTGSVESPDLVLDLKKAVPAARQVYGLTFHPRFESNRWCYLCYVLEPNLDDGTRLSRFHMKDSDPPTIDATTEEVLLTWRSGGHNGGCLKFGPDGYLYVSAGDAGPAFPPDPLKAGQDIGNVLSTVMRIDVDRADGDRKYAIPTDNPFRGVEGARAEVWAYGFRNPWKMSFDSATGELWVGDVGWELWEMVYRVQRGGNYGWSLVEGRQPVHRERTRGPSPILKPTAEHPHTEARSITGGFVYRGNRLPDLQGEYVYGDYVTGKMWALKATPNQSPQIREIADSRMPIICFGVDNDNELYVVSYEGQIHRLKSNPATEVKTTFPRRLSETGLFRSVDAHTLADGVNSYEIIAEMWQDGVTTERFVAVPGTGPLTNWKTNNAALGQFKDLWQFPEGSVLGKTIMLPNATRDRVETQILHYHNGVWEPYTYVWNAQQTDATLLETAGQNHPYKVDLGDGNQESRSWRIAGRNECMLCHTTRSGALQGFHVAQLDKSIPYGGGKRNQLEHLTELGYFAKRPKRPRNQPEYVSPYREDVDLNARARAYLHVNCAHCHRRGGGGTASMDVVHRNALAKTNLLDERPTQGTFGIHGAKVVAPGDPYRSVLLYRMAKTGRGRMPYIGSSQVDAAGLQLMRDWIRSLPVDHVDTASESRKQRRKGNRNLVEQAFAKDAKASQMAVEKLMSTTSGALRLAVEHHSRRAGSLDAKAILSDDPTRRDLFESLLPESMRRKLLGESIDPNEILALSGDRDRGRKLFEKAAGLQCRKCHAPEANAPPIGPTLADMSKRTRAELLDSILYPSKRIDPKFLTYLVETQDGRVFSGLLAKRDESKTVLVDATGKQVTIAANDIEFSSPQQKSLMPELQLRDSTAQEVADLLEYLSSQGRTR